MTSTRFVGAALAVLLPFAFAFDDGCCLGPTCPDTPDDGADTDGEPVPHSLPGEHPCDRIAASRFTAYEWTFSPFASGDSYREPALPVGGAVYWASAGDAPDVVGMPAPWWAECKYGDRATIGFVLEDGFTQANRPHTKPVVFFRRQRQPLRAVVLAADLLDVLAEVERLRAKLEQLKGAQG